MKRIVLLRHGQSTWNKENRFTGWTDVDLTQEGVAEAVRAGELLRDEGFTFGKAYTSYLKRAVKTLDCVLDKLDEAWSMDILISSNLERLLYHVSGSSEKVAGWMQELSATGKYTVDAETLAKIQQSFAAGYADDADGAAEIKARFDGDHYLCDTHTAVAFRVAETRRTDAPMVVLSTASPFKFPRDVLTALGVEAPASDFAAMAALTAGTGAEAPASLRELDKLEVRFKTVLQPADIRTAALR